MRRDPYASRARELAAADGYNPDMRIEGASGRGVPIWTTYRQAARDEHNAAEQAKLAATLDKNNVANRAQPEAYQNAPLLVVGEHELSTVEQMRNCMKVGNVVAGVICADGHLGYAQPVGGVIAYEGQISVSGVGFDIGCGNMAVRLDLPFEDIRPHVLKIAQDIQRVISFGTGRVNDEKVDHPIFDRDDAWRAADREDYRQKARAQLGTVGGGNHYVDLLVDEKGFVWIGVHFGSRGLGHSSATKYIKEAGGKDGINVPPVVLDEDSEIGQRYLQAMWLAGDYAYAGRKWVVERVRKIIGGAVTDTVHNHHNFAWQEGADDLWVVRKGATPAFPGQRGFIGGSMGDDAVIVRGVDGPKAAGMLYSTVHGAGRMFGRKEAKRRYTRAEMDEWLLGRGVTVMGGDVDESPMAYRRLPDVLKYHADTIEIQHTLRPFVVVMAGEGEFDPWKD
jgi:tRNA-splicing ligase RtcB (3'-phosphate/5'-hydroxy nucleic acid ligase)